jgi:hypothetical protein
MRGHYKLGTGSGKKSQFTATRKRLHLHIYAQGEAAPWVDHRETGADSTPSVMWA